VQELRGEKIDIIPWHVDPAKFVCNALAPAEISRVIIDEVNQTMEVIVPDDFLSIAIGKKGQNVRLASKLTGWNLDVKSETKYTIAMQSGYDSLVALSGVGISLADALYELGFYSAEEVSNATPEDLIQIRGIGEDTAKKLIAAAQKAVVEAEQAAEIEEEAVSKADSIANDETAGIDADAASQTVDKEVAQVEEVQDEAAEEASETNNNEDDAPSGKNAQGHQIESEGVVQASGTASEIVESDTTIADEHSGDDQADSTEADTKNR
jgi:N utilization substance protein A